MNGWTKLPVDDVGYVHPKEVLAKSDSDLRKWVAEFERRRYHGWRNHDNMWRSTLRLDSTRGKHVVDYGCGFGIEALQFAKTDNQVTLMDLTEEGLQAAKRVLGVHGYEAELRSIGEPIPAADVFYANGVLHHTPKIGEIMAEAAECCDEARLLVYSDKMWERFKRKSIGVPQPSFVRAMDEVGDHADWYTPDTLEQACTGWKLREATYISPGDLLLTAILDPA